MRIAEVKSLEFYEGAWIVKVYCPFCGEVHTHGGGDGKKAQLGPRSSHCWKGAGGDYEMREAVRK